jgi:transcriptional regulator with XRE-family HTH domain
LFLIGNILMAKSSKLSKARSTQPLPADYAARFGAMVREAREALKLRQEDIVFATGVGRRFIIELEAGKPSCQLGKALVVAAAVGLRPFDVMSQNVSDDNALLPDLPDPPESEEPVSG